MKQWSLFVMIRSGWMHEGRIGVSLGPAMKLIPYEGSNGQYWTPVLWDGEEDPDWFKSVGLKAVLPKKSAAKRLLQRIQQPDMAP